jgi:hypothetical protein
VVAVKRATTLISFFSSTNEEAEDSVCYSSDPQTSDSDEVHSYVNKSRHRIGIGIDTG